MIISNRSAIDTKEIVSIVKQIPNLPNDVYCIIKKCKKSDQYSGTAYKYPKPSIKHDKCKYTVVIRISTDENHYPMKNYYYDSYSGNYRVYGGINSPKIDYKTYQECLLGVIIHELEHINAYRLNTHNTETDCEIAVYRMLKRYRENNK